MRRPLRRIFERLSRGVVLKRRLPRDLGGVVLYVSPDVALRYWRSDVSKVDPALLCAARELVRQGDVVWDVGANVGLFTFASAALAGLGGRVVAVEPDPFPVGLLRRSQEANLDAAIAPINVVEAAASEREGTARLLIAARGRASSHLEGAGQSQSGGPRAEVQVRTLTLDGLLVSFPAPDVLKVDVEGHAAAVLRGAGRVLTGADRPRILCEVDEKDADEATRLLQEAGYELFDGDLPPGHRRRLERAVWNTVALPERRP